MLQRDVIFKGFLLSRCGSGALTREEGALGPILFFFWHQSFALQTRPLPREFGGGSFGSCAVPER